MQVEKIHEAPQSLGMFSRRTSSAMFSECDQYRYYLMRCWDNNLPLLGYIMLNPSKATESEDDPTARRCEVRAAKLGYGGFIIVNAFALRATDPTHLNTKYPVEAHSEPNANDDAILLALQVADKIICAWGDSCPAKMKDQLLMDRETLAPHAHKLHHLGLNDSGNPKHPLYIPYDVKPQPFTPKYYD